MNKTIMGMCADIVAEKDAEHELLIDQFEEETEKLRKQIKQESDARKRFVEEVKNLKQQLAEKKKEIEELKDYIGCKGCIDLIAKTHQDKISFAVEKLENVKEWFKRNAINDVNNNAILIDHSYTGVLMLLDGKIEELKGENK